MKNNGHVTCKERGFVVLFEALFFSASDTRTPLFALGPAGAERPREGVCASGWEAVVVKRV